MIKLFVICSIQFFLLINNLSAQTGYELAKKLDNKDKPQNMTSRISMTLTNAKNKSRKNVMISKTANQSQKQMIWVLEPKSDRGMSFLKIEREDRKTEMRIWLPAFNKIRRINANRRSNSFMGSDLSYEDMMSWSIDDNTYLRLEDDQIEGKECYVLEVIPKKSINTSY
ncbi:MAG: outer membrane lipoprotein-sorting protein, partial [Candidatus Marinimicrobia bacterium]|nr:outer membrane lipoprotein-sorting protein [Candidatus Neomarinimicrobiota bacterium]